MSVIRSRTLYDRETLHRSIARYLGFTRLTQESLRLLKFTLDSAIRCCEVESVGERARNCSLDD